MSIETVLLDFHVTPCLDDLVYVRDVATVATCVAEALRQDCLEQGCISSAFSYSAIYSGPKDCMFTIKHYFREGLITLSLEYFKINQEDALLFDYTEVERLERLVTRNLDADYGASIPPIKRCLPKSPYLRTSDDRIVEYKWDKLLFSERSPYQLVEIYSTPDFGNCLVLDGFINLAESDLVYTHTLMCHGKQEYKGKEVLILGGGDGALLNELVKEKPKFVTMVDIDEAVIRSCKEHMRSACGEVLDKLETEEYKIIVDDAAKWLKTFKEEKKQFDVIFGDLTDIPVHQGDSTWAWIRSIVKIALSLLPVGGKYYTHCNGVNSLHAVQYFENLLSSIGVPIQIERTEAFVPSFCEKWIFFQLTRKEGDITEDVNGDTVSNEAEEKVEAPVVNEKDAENADPIKEDKKGETKKETKKEETKKEETKKEEVKKEKPSPEKKEDKKGGAKDLKDKLETGKEKGLTKEKSNLDKKGKKAK